MKDVASTVFLVFQASFLVLLAIPAIFHPGITEESISSFHMKLLISSLVWLIALALIIFDTFRKKISAPFAKTGLLIDILLLLFIIFAVFSPAMGWI